MTLPCRACGYEIAPGVAACPNCGAAYGQAVTGKVLVVVTAVALSFVGVMALIYFFLIGTGNR